MMVVVCVGWCALSIPKTFTMARQLMDNSPFEIPSLDHPASSLYNFKSRRA